MLAFACAFTMFAGAAFTDQADIEATEAVEMLAALGVIDGYEDGSYRPNDTVTRAEMAKMIYVARTGSDNADSYKSAATSFTDITNHWAAGYIKYCQALGIIAGKSTTSFDPDATVTGVEAAKMLLVTMGYQADRAGLEGTGWDQQTLGLASENNLLDDVNADLYAALPRQYAAQVIYNTLDADRVVWSTDANGFDYYTDRNGGRETVGYRYLKLCTDVGTLTTIDEDTLTINVSAADANLSYHKTIDSYTFTKISQDYSSLLGQKVRVMFKDGKLNDVLGVYADIDNTTYTVNANAVEADGANKIKFNGETYNVELKGTTDKADADKGDALLTYIDGNAQAEGYTTAALDAMDTSANVLIFADTDGNNKIDTVYEQTVTVAKVTYVSDSQIVAGGKTYKAADDNIADGLAKNDWVVITKNSYNDNNDIVKADMIEATINGYKDKSSYHQYRVDGTWYNTADGKTLDAAAGDTADVVVYNGIIFYADKISGSAGSASVAMVVDTGSFNQAKLAFFDGTEKTVTLDTDGVTAPTKGSVYVYEVNGDEYKLSDLNATNLDNDDYTILTATLKDSSDSALSGTNKVATVNGTAIADTAKVLLYSTAKSSSKLITGKQLKALAYSGGTGANAWTAVAGTAALSEKVDGLTKASIIAVKITGAMPSDFQTNDNYAVVVSDSFEYNSDYITYDVFDGETTITVTEKTSTATRAKGNIIGYSSITEDNVIEDVTLYTEGSANATSNTANRYAIGAIEGVNDNGTQITVDGTNTFKITSDTKVILVDSDAENGKDAFEGVPGSSIDKDNEADEIADTGLYYYNCAYILDGTLSNGEADLSVLVVDVKNRLYNTKETAQSVSTLTNVTATIDGETVTAGSTSLDKGEVMMVTVGTGMTKVTLTNAKFADGATSMTGLTGGEILEVYADGKGDVEVAAANS